MVACDWSFADHMRLLLAVRHQCRAVIDSSPLMSGCDWPFPINVRLRLAFVIKVWLRIVLDMFDCDCRFLINVLL